MKHIKAYEHKITHIFNNDRSTQEIEIDVNDYIIIKDNYIKNWKQNNYNTYKCAKIIRIHDNLYDINCETLTNGNIITFYLNVNVIERKATTEESEEWELEKDSVKYKL